MVRGERLTRVWGPKRYVPSDVLDVRLADRGNFSPCRGPRILTRRHPSGNKMRAHSQCRTMLSRTRCLACHDSSRESRSDAMTLLASALAVVKFR
ncbi:hypothetical protein GW17_00055967 [Ensete ventricosum]|nr:hypothetical protein GW17_00055967 [Ensete ventricosum]